MKVLFICHRFPFPPARGGKIRPFNVIRHLAATHDVTVCSLARSVDEERAGQGIASHCSRFFSFRVNPFWQWARMILRLFTLTPSSMGYFYSRNMARQIDDLLTNETFDLIFVHCSSVAQYVRNVNDTPKVLDFGDMDSQKWLDYRRFKPWPLSMGYWLEGTKLERAEYSLARQFEICTATTRSEWAHLDGMHAASVTDWFPNGVDSDFFCPDGTDYDRHRICFVGRMDYFPNQQAMFEFCEQVWPELRARHPEIVLDIIGADPSPKVCALAELPGVTVTGSVPDVRPYVRRSLLMIAPLRIARGTQNKILESMAMGVPVVTTTLAAGGVDATPGVDLLVADSVPDQVAAVSGLFEIEASRKAFAEAGRNRILTHHSWPNSMARLEKILGERLSAISDKPATAETVV